VLLVDDNEDSARSLELLLGLAGHDVRVAHAGGPALGIAREFQPEVILLDIGLPGMDGYTVARRLRQEPTVPRPTIVALTGYGQEQDRNEALDSGFDVHMTKPVDPEELCDWLASLDGPPA
jgi:CheY-like chemotaxis protein